MNINANAFLSRLGGTIVVNDTSAKVAKFNGVYFGADTVIAEILDKDGTDVTADYATTPATGYKAGDILTAQGDNWFTSITLTSGSATLILR